MRRFPLQDVERFIYTLSFVWRLVVGRSVKGSAFRNQPAHSVVGGGGGMGGNGRKLCATGGSGGPSEPSGPWAKYLELLESHPFMTRAVTCGVLNGLGKFCPKLLLNFHTRVFLTCRSIVVCRERDWLNAEQCLEWTFFFAPRSMCTLCITSSTGDIVSQMFIEGGGFDFSRTLTFTCMGLFFVGPVLFYWWDLLNTIAQKRYAHAHTIRESKCVVLNFMA
jgi:hypothetical protein